jgi:OmpA-OmpF porin, OOP family
MRRILIALALSSSALSGAAFAREKAVYIEGDFGAVVATANRYKLPSGDATGRLETKTGYDAGGIIGYDTGFLRLEVEGSYREAKARSLNGSPLALGFGNGPVNGTVSAKSVMGNALLDFGADTGLQVYGGGGAGYARIKQVVNSGTSKFTLIHDQQNKFAWQLIGGIRAPLGANWDIGVKYRYFNVDGLDITSRNGTRARSSLRTHSVMGTLAYNFGGRPAPEPVAEMAPPPPVAEVAPPPPPPPPPPVVQCNQGPYIVFFDWNQSDLTPEASAILDNAVAAYGNCNSIPIMLAGYADRSGSATYNQGLSERRNTTVRGYLTGHGIPAGGIGSKGFGEENNRVPTADGVRELQNRRVEITYGPGSGN